MSQSWGDEYAAGTRMDWWKVSNTVTEPPVRSLLPNKAVLSLLPVSYGCWTAGIVLLASGHHHAIGVATMIGGLAAFVVAAVVAG